MKNIMIVDDSFAMCTAVSCALTENGYNPIPMMDGQEALDYLKYYSNIDLFICDIRMPLVDGIKFVKKVRVLKKHAKTPIVMLTTESRPLKKIEAKEAGATGWITKPFTNAKIIDMIYTLIGK